MKAATIVKENILDDKADNSEIFDEVVTELSSLRGVLGATIYLINPNGMLQESPLDDFEVWFVDMRNRLDRVIEKMHQMYGAGT